MAETLVERTAVESHQSTCAMDRMNRKVAGLLRTLKAALEARISGKAALDQLDDSPFGVASRDSE